MLSINDRFAFAGQGEKIWEGMKKLSRAQAHIVNILMENPNYYVRKSTYYNYNEVLSPEMIKSEYNHDTHHVEYFTRPTFDVLLRIGAIVQDGIIYRLKR